jgi:cytochrome d ubiquinol oxidase subunit I
MTIAAIAILRSMARRWREGAGDLPSPYGPKQLAAEGPAEVRDCIDEKDGAGEKVAAQADSEGTAK